MKDLTSELVKFFTRPRRIERACRRCGHVDIVEVADDGTETPARSRSRCEFATVETCRQCEPRGGSV